MACKKCGKMKCACGGMASKKAKYAAGGMVSKGAKKGAMKPGRGNEGMVMKPGRGNEGMVPGNPGRGMINDKFLRPGTPKPPGSDGISAYTPPSRPTGRPNLTGATPRPLPSPGPGKPVRKPLPFPGPGKPPGGGKPPGRGLEGKPPRTTKDLPMYRGPNKPEIMEPELRGRGGNTTGGSVASGGGGSSVSVKKFRKGGMIKRGKKGC